MKHKLPIAIVVVAAAAAITGVVSFKTGVFQTASIAELTQSFTKPLAVLESVEDSSLVNSAPDTAIGSPGSECEPTTAPWFQILSPNGNESYNPGHAITVKWISCNIKPTDSVHVSLIWKDSKNGPGGLVQPASLNDNQEVITLPSEVGDGKEYVSGKAYKIQIVQSANGSPNYNGAIDTSDDYFSIINKK